MRRMRTGIGRSQGLTAVAVALFGLSLAPASATVRGGQGKRPRPLVVRAGGESVVATQGSYCVSGRHVGACADYAYPLHVRGRLGVSAGERVLLATGDHAIHAARVSLLHATKSGFHPLGWSATARRIPGHPTTLWIHLPDDLGRANRLDISAVYAHHRGDSDWWAGVKPPRAP